jgi:glycosyltransferase involved in cell wall biosynthesis
MTVRPTVTVCIPTYNRRPLLARSLRSVLDQDVDSLEVIVSDNASTDDTGEFVASIDDPRLRYERSSENVGLFGNLTRCLQLGTGHYRVMLPDDDMMLPGNIDRKVRFLEDHPSAGMVHSAFRLIGPDGVLADEKRSWSRLTGDTLEPGESFLRRSITIGGIVCIPSVMLRSSVVAGETFNGDDGPYADLALWLRVASRSDVGFLDEALSGYMVHAGSASSGFDVVKVMGDRGERHQLSSRHADAVHLAHGRFVERPELDDALRTDLAARLRTADRRMRLAILANRTVPPAVLAGMKRLVGWRHGGLLHRFLALDAATSASAAASTLPTDPGMLP